MLKNLYTQIDFMNLTNAEINDIKNTLELEIPEEMEDRMYLFQIINTLEHNVKSNKIIKNKVLAGKTSLKWFKFEFNVILSKELLIEKLESSDFGYNINIANRSNSIDTITCCCKENNIYTLKILIKDGLIKHISGINVRSEEKIKDIVVKIDIDNCWVEIRCDDKKVNKIKSILSRELNLINLEEVIVLDKYQGDINDFKDSLENGKYLNCTAIPRQPVNLAEEDKEAIATIIKSLDEYLCDRDGNKLIEKLDALNYDPEELSIISILLAGLDVVGMGISPESNNDMSDQAFYNILRDYITENRSFLKFSIQPNGISYTMQVGHKSNNIRFMSSVTEDVIDYVRNKIL